MKSAMRFSSKEKPQKFRSFSSLLFSKNSLRFFLFHTNQNVCLQEHFGAVIQYRSRAPHGAAMQKVLLDKTFCIYYTTNPPKGQQDTLKFGD